MTGPWYMNFGKIGLFIAHEIAHGFDNIGAQFDFEGKLIDWWKPETKAKYLERIECIIKQYDSYTEPLIGQRVCN